MRIAIIVSLLVTSLSAQQYVYTPVDVPQPFQHDQTAAIKEGTLRLKASSLTEYAWLPATIPAGEYQLTLTASLYLGASGPAMVAVRLSRGGTAIANFEMITLPEQEYSAKVVFTTANPTLYFNIKNAFVNPNDETRIRIRNVILEKIMPGGPEGGKAKVLWRPVPDTDLAGYRLSYGQSFDDEYLKQVDAAVNCDTMVCDTVNGLAYGATYYFRVKAFDFSGNESEYSDQAEYVVPKPTINPRIVFDWPAAGFVSHDDSITATYHVTGDTSFIVLQEYCLDGLPYGIATNNSKVTFTAVGLTEGKHEVSAKLFTVDNVLLHDATVIFYVAFPDTTPPAKPQIIRIERIK